LPIDQKDASADDNSQPQQPEAPASEKALADLGLTVGPSDDGKGLAITDIDPNSDAADKGIKEGEKITSVNNQEVSSADDIVKVLNQAKKDGRTRALFQIQSSEGSRFVALPINGQG
jgi:serine protease Do